MDRLFLKQTDISELNLPKTTTIAFPNGKDDLMNFEVSIRPDEGYYQDGTFVFTFQVSPIYPHESPRVKCNAKRTYYAKPTLFINMYSGTIPTIYEDSLKHDAAGVLRDNPKIFESKVRRAMSGGYVGADILYAIHLALSGQVGDQYAAVKHM